MRACKAPLTLTPPAPLLRRRKPASKLLTAATPHWAASAPRSASLAESFVSSPESGIDSTAIIREKRGGSAWFFIANEPRGSAPAPMSAGGDSSKSGRRNGNSTLSPLRKSPRARGRVFWLLERHQAAHWRAPRQRLRHTGRDGPRLSGRHRHFVKGPERGRRCRCAKPDRRRPHGQGKPGQISSCALAR